MHLNSDGRPVLIVPVENQVRELDAKLLLAAVAAERGFRVILGSQSFIFLAMPSFPRGVFIAKSMRAVNDQTLELIRLLGHSIVAWDEEALVRFESPEYYSWRYSSKTFSKISRLFCWGPNDAKFFASFSGYAGAPIHVTGNPRTDLLRPELRGFFDGKVEQLRREHGRFVLINTNFSFVNHHLASLNLLQGDGAAHPHRLSRAGLGLSLPFGMGMAEHQEAIFKAFQHLIAKMSRALPHTKFIVRPHPSENRATWRRHVTDWPNVEVIHDGNVVPWLIASQGLIHNGCTTAVEAAMLGTASISYQPVRSPTFDYHLPNRLSHPALTIDDAIDLAREMAVGELGVKTASLEAPLWGEHLASTEGSLASDRIIDVMIEAGYQRGSLDSGTVLARACGQIGMRSRGLIQQLKMRVPGHRNNLRNHAHHFPDLEPNELTTRVRALGARLGRFADVRVTGLSPHLFVVARDTGGRNHGYGGIGVVDRTK